MTRRILFIGNSFTARNDLPDTVCNLAEAAGLEAEYRLISIGGASLKNHWNKGDARRAIESGKYDTVVLQEQSTLPVKNPARTHENIRLFDPLIRAADARTALYLTWARKLVPETQEVLTETYRSIGKEIGATVCPAGVAWQNLLTRGEGPVLHDKDGSHPTPAGSFLAACVIFASLFDLNPSANDVETADVPASDRKLLAKEAWKTVKAWEKR